MRVLPAALALLALAAPLALAGDPPGPTCGLTVCAEARSDIVDACVQGADAGEAVLSCTLTFTSFSWGHSPVLLPGRVFLGGDAAVQWRCTEGCAEGHVERNVNAYATWWGGPEVEALDLGSADGGTVTILVHELALRAPPGSGACLTYHAELETTALAETPHTPAPVPGGWLEEVLDGDGAIVDATRCLG